MKLIIERDTLATALEAVAGRLKSKRDLPILKCVLLDAGSGGVTLTGHDIDSCSITRARAEVDTAGRIAVGGDQLIRLVGAMPKGAQVALSLDGTTLKVKSGRSTYRMPTRSPDDFPSALDVGDVPEIAVKSDDVKRMFRVRAAMDRGAKTTNYSGVFLHVASNKRLSAMGTVGIQLLRASVEGRVPAKVPGILVPKFAVDEILRLVGTSETVSFGWNERLLRVTAGETSFVTCLLNEQAPPYERFVPELEHDGLSVVSADMLAALDRLESIAKEGSDVTLSWDADPTELRMTLAGDGDGVEEIECQGQGVPAGVVTVPYGQLPALLRAADIKMPRFHVRAPNVPFRVVDPDDPHLIVIQVPSVPNRARAPQEDTPDDEGEAAA